MSNFKKFAQFCGGIAAFSAIMYVFRQFMSYDPEEIESKKEKLKLFFSNEMSKDHRPLVMLFLLLCLAIAVGVVLKRLPQICIAFSTLPLLYSLTLHNGDKLYERPMLYILLSAILVIGDIYDAIYADRADGKRRVYALANVSAAVVCAVCAFIKWRERMSGLVPTEKLGYFDRQLVLFSKDYDSSLFLIIGVMLAVTVIVSLILRGVYFIDLALTLVPFFYTVFKMATEELGPHGETVVAAVTVCLVCRIAALTCHCGACAEENEAKGA